MNFDDTPAEAAFRAKARSWLDANAPKHLEAQLRKAGFASSGGATPEDSKAWQRKNGGDLIRPDLRSRKPKHPPRKHGQPRKRGKQPGCRQKHQKRPRPPDRPVTRAGREGVHRKQQQPERQPERGVEQETDSRQPRITHGISAP